jgi:hypothetical protein
MCKHARKWILALTGGWFWCGKCGAITGGGMQKMWLKPPLERPHECPRPEAPFSPEVTTPPPWPEALNGVPINEEGGE